MPDFILGYAHLFLVAFLQDQQTFRSHVEQQVGDAEVGQETELFLEHLIIGLRMERRVGQAEILLGMDDFAEVLFMRQKLGTVFGSYPK